MQERPTGLPETNVKRAVVKEMFDRIAPRYDLVNRIITAGMDQQWRRRLLKGAGLRSEDCLVDVACGTGDLLLIARQSGANCLGVDLSRAMLGYAFCRDDSLNLISGDAANLPVADKVASIVTCGFALRNFVSLPPVWSEFSRVLRTGGKLAILEVDRPENTLIRWFHSLYFDGIVPALGGLVSDREAYRYLPRSTKYLPGSRELFRQLHQAGFTDIHREVLFLGSAQLIYARKV